MGWRRSGCASESPSPLLAVAHGGVLWGFFPSVRSGGRAEAAPSGDAQGAMEKLLVGAVISQKGETRVGGSVWHVQGQVGSAAPHGDAVSLLQPGEARQGDPGGGPKAPGRTPAPSGFAGACGFWWEVRAGVWL